MINKSSPVCKPFFYHGAGGCFGRNKAWNRQTRLTTPKQLRTLSVFLVRRNLRSFIRLKSSYHKILVILIWARSYYCAKRVCVV